MPRRYSTQERMKARIYPDEPIQWHLKSTRHDKCPRCGSSLGWLGARRRMCMGPGDECGVWTFPFPTTRFERMKAEGTRINYVTGEIEKAEGNDEVPEGSVLLAFVPVPTEPEQAEHPFGCDCVHDPEHHDPETGACHYTNFDYGPCPCAATPEAVRAAMRAAWRRQREARRES